MPERESNYFEKVPKFESPEEELSFLREKISQKEREILEKAPQELNKEEITKDVLNKYKEIQPEEVLKDSQIVKETEAQEIVLRLRPESHDSQMEEMLSILLDKGIKNTFLVLERMNNPHLDDDFHRFLVQYIQSTNKIPGLKENLPLFSALKMHLFEITLPEIPKEEAKNFKEMISAMQQFYAGMQSVASGRDRHGKDYFTLEIALSNESDSIIIYASIPSSKIDLFEKQILSFYQQAKIREITDDYNIFSDQGESAGSYAQLEFPPAFPIKLFDQFESDPMNVILNVFSKLKPEGEGAAIQFIISPSGDKFIKEFNVVLSEAKEGEKVRRGISTFGRVGKEFGKIAKEIVFGVETKAEKTEKKIDDKAIEQITKKVASTIVKTNLRIITSAKTKERSEEILTELESAFNQFHEANSNNFVFKKLVGKKLQELFHYFSYRLLNDKYQIALSLNELSTVFHFPIGVTSSPQLKEARAGIAPAPMEMGKEGILLGVNNYRGRETNIFFGKEDRMRHFYTIGQTGTGKTSLLKNMIVQDIKNGDGVCFIDPHGSDIQDILSQIPIERIDDVIYFDPAYASRPMALNMLEYDQRFPEQKSFVVNEMMSIFNKLFDMKTAGGPMFEQYFRNATNLVLEDQESGNTLLDISRVLANEEFRELKLSHCKNPIVVQFWREIASKAGGEASLANIVPYITSKFDVFLSNEIMRPIVAQEKSTFNFREVMDQKKILLVNLSKGRLGDINANLLGLILVGKILMAALSRVDVVGTGKPINDFYLYIDEFQNVTTDSIAVILSEARKYRLSLNIAHQFIAQLEEKTKDAVFGNVGSMAIYRVGVDDAEYLQSQFVPVFTATDLIKIDNFNSYVKLLVNGQPTKPFNMTALPPNKGNIEMIEKIKELSYVKYGRNRSDVEAEIAKKYEKKRL